MKIINRVLFVLIVLTSCKPSPSSEVGHEVQTQMSTNDKPVAKTELQVLVGETMGTTYSMKYAGKLLPDLKGRVDQLLVEINDAVSTYIDHSIISSFNKSKGHFDLADFPKDLQGYFVDNYRICREIYDSSDGHFDPTVMPVVNYWGFGYDGRKKITKIDSTKIDRILTAVGMDKIKYDPDSRSWSKTTDGVELDFSAVAKGYAVDKVSAIFDQLGLTDYYIEIGGECKAKGNKSGVPWLIGVSLPDPKAGLTDLVTKIDLVNTSVATSGNYRNYYELDDQIISHTINPKTGFPERNTLLSATVFHPSCAQADALATACMSMGYEEGFPYIDEMPGVECFMVYISSKGQILEAASAGIGDLIH